MRSRLAVMVTIAAWVLVALAPAASAQLIPDLPGDVGGDLGGGGSGPGDGDGGGLISDPVGDLIDTITPGDDEKSSPSTEDPLSPIKDAVDKTLEGPKDEADKITNNPDGYVGGILKQPAETKTQTGTTPKTTDKLAGKKRHRKADGRSATTTGAERFGDRNPVYRPGIAATVDKEAEKNVRLVSTVATEPTTDDGIIGEVIHQIGRVAAEAVQRAAFPLTLALLVGAFLMVQNRVDRRDPKLALAPVDSEQELLTFS